MSDQSVNNMPPTPQEPTPQPTLENMVKSEVEKEEEEHRRLFTVEQFLAMQHIAQDVANTQFKRVAVATSNLIISVVALLTSAFGLVTALAWNRAISDWLPTVNFLPTNDRLIKEFIYAGALTIFVVIALGLIGILLQRVRGENLLER